MEVSLNENQRKAVEHLGKPLMIVAGPGSGKTRVIVERVKYLVTKRGINPEQILCLTFSDKAAEEMANRLDKEIDISGMQIGTFHSFCLNILKDNVLDSGISFSSGLISRSNQLVWGLKNIDSFGFEEVEIGNNTIGVIESMIDGISTFRDELISPKELAGYIVQKRTQQLGEEETATINKLADLLKVYQKYEQFKRKESLIDFDDMIHIVIELLRKKPLILSSYQKAFKEVLVDEFQDTNYAQLELIKLLCLQGNVTVVGDDDQSIYRFRGAYLTNFKDFKRHYQDHEQIILDQNYRNTGEIIEVSKQLIDIAPNRLKKQLRSENEEGDKVVVAKCENENAEVEFVLGTIRELIGKELCRRDKNKDCLSYKDIAILSRRRMEGMKYARALKGFGIPCTFVGESNVFSSPIIRDLMAFLRVANNPTNQGIEINRILKVHGVTEQNIQRINQLAKNKSWKEKQSNSDFVFEALREVEQPPVSQKTQITEIYEQLQTLVDLKTKTTVTEFIFETMMSITDLYKRTVQTDSVETRRNRLVLNEFYHIAQEFESITKNSTLLDFLSYLDLMSGFEIEIKEGAKVSDSVQVTTIHQSKGKEYPVVFVVDVATNRLPLKYRSKPFFVPNELSKGVQITVDEKKLSLEEERRLLYVAMTRAQNKLFLTYAEKYGENVTKTKPSVFLDEIKFNLNSNIQLAEIKESEASTVLQAENRVERLTHEFQRQAVKAVNQMQLKTAVQKIVDLAKIKHFEAKGDFSTFDPNDVLTLEVTDQDLENALEGKTLPLIDQASLHFSASRLQCYNDCPLKFKFQYVLDVPTVPRTYFDLGSAVHSVIEHLTKLEIQGQKSTKQLALKLLDKYWCQNAYANRKQEDEDRSKAEQMLDNYLAWSSSKPNRSIASEKAFEIQLNGFKVKGKIDLVETTPAGDYCVLDFKTGYAKENRNTIKENIQINIYALAIKKLYGRLPKLASLYYLKDDKHVVYAIQPELVQAVEDRLKQQVDVVVKEEFSPTPSYQICKYCEYTSICDEKQIEE